MKTMNNRQFLICGLCLLLVATCFWGCKPERIETGKPMDVDGNVYMQVLDAGDRANDKVKSGEPIYFRYSRYNLATWYASGTWTEYSGNESSMDAVSCSFKYGDYSLPSTSQWGYGIQFPLLFLGVECEVNLIIKSQYGFTSEISYVLPFFYHIRYYHSMI